MIYRETQIGWLLISLFTTVMALLYFAYAFQWGNPPTFNSLIVLLILLTTITLLFYKLTVKIDSSGLKIIFGIGVIRINPKIDHILKIQSIKTPWYYGLGIRKTDNGIQYNIQGSQALEINYTTKNKNKTIVLGTKDPVRLMNILKSNFKEA